MLALKSNISHASRARRRSRTRSATLCVTGMAPAPPAIAVIFFMVRINTLTPSPASCCRSDSPAAGACGAWGLTDGNEPMLPRKAHVGFGASPTTRRSAPFLLPLATFEGVAREGVARRRTRGWTTRQHIPPPREQLRNTRSRTPETTPIRAYRPLR